MIAHHGLFTEEGLLEMRLVFGWYPEVGTRPNLARDMLSELAGSYIRLLEQAHIVFRVGSYARNLRNELTASSKIYFYDTGVRNAVIADFSPASARTDIGHLFENFVMSEIRKTRCAIGKPEPLWFWRTTSGQEIDLIRSVGQDVAAYEIKWNPTSRAAFPASFRAAYPQAPTTVITRNNVLKILAGLADP